MYSDRTAYFSPGGALERFALKKFGWHLIKGDNGDIRSQFVTYDYDYEGEIKYQFCDLDIN